MRHQTFGVTIKEETAREKQNRELARCVVEEGIVLLENNGVLPLQIEKVALYGTGSRMTVKGGSGSGDVRERYCVSVEQGLKNAGFEFPTTLWMDRFEQKFRKEIATWKATVEDAIKGIGPVKTMQMFNVIASYPKPCPACTPIYPDELTSQTSTAIYVISRQAGEGRDRRVEKGDYLLSDIEEESIKFLRANYAQLILVINAGGVLDLSILDTVAVDAVVLMGQGGEEGGNALANVLAGKVSPSGKLTDTWAYKYSDYPSSDTFSFMNGNLEDEEYSEGIFVGYRHFDRALIKPRYPFGHGLSYTTFSLHIDEIWSTFIRVSVTNTGTVAGKETVLAFVKKPKGKLEHELKSLVAFEKTKLLSPGESETLTLPLNLSLIASYFEEKKAFVLEKGTYEVVLNSNTEANFSLDKEITIESCCHEEKPFSSRVYGLLNKLNDYDKIKLVTGGGYTIKCYNNVMGAAGRTCTRLLKKGIPNIVLSDGPAGINLLPITTTTKGGSVRYPEGLPEDWNWGWIKKFEPLIKNLPGTKSGITTFRYMTAWPSETVQAQTWNLSLIEDLGRAVGTEMLEVGVSVWLAPALNIHRNPLCGRNFEYYSEDPVVAGKMAAAVTSGVQSMGGVGVSQKHFLCNNQEDNRTGVSSNVGERALREIYLRAFEIAVKEGKPWTIMTSYNKVNGQYVNNSRHFCTEILRTEWGFDGLIMTDWNASEQSSHSQAINSGNDLLMPGNNGVIKVLKEDLKTGKLDRASLNKSAGRVLELIFKSETCKDFR